MEYLKKVLILKEILSGYSYNGKSVGGIARFEQEDGVTDFSVSLINLKKTDGKYYVYILSNSSNLTQFELESKPVSSTFNLSDFDIKKGFAVAITEIYQEIPTLIAFAKTENCNLSINDFKSAVINKFIKERESLNAIYDDEVVATENYFENEMDYNDYIDLENDDIKKEPYVLKIKQELDDVFSKFEKEETLERIIPNSKWVKINYSKNKYYVVGLMYENGNEKYICYGVPAPYSTTPPLELKGYCSFVPISVFNLKGDGYWIMFQDANSGTCVKPD